MFLFVFIHWSFNPPKKINEKKKKNPMISSMPFILILGETKGACAFSEWEHSLFGLKEDLLTNLCNIKSSSPHLKLTVLMRCVLYMHPYILNGLN